MKIFVDGKLADDISRAELRSIVIAAWEDPRVLCGQIFNILGCACRLLRAILVTIPLVMFWILAGCVLGEAYSTMSFSGPLLRHSDLIVSSLHRLLAVSFFVSTMCCVVSVLLGFTTFGFKNYVAREVRSRVRERIGYAGVGRVTVEDAMPAPAVAP